MAKNEIQISGRKFNLELWVLSWTFIALAMHEASRSYYAGNRLNVSHEFFTSDIDEQATMLNVSVDATNETKL